MPIYVRDPKSLSKADLAEIVSRFQVLMYGDEDPESMYLLWNENKEVNGADLVDLTGQILHEFDLAPIHKPREWIPKSRRRPG